MQRNPHYLTATPSPSASLSVSARRSTTTAMSPRRRMRTPSTAHVISARAAVAALSSEHAEVVVYDARNSALVALERVTGAICWGSSSHTRPRTRHSGGDGSADAPGLALVYDAGTTTLEVDSRARDVVHGILAAHPVDMRVCLISGGLPALRSCAPQCIVTAPRTAAETDRLRAKLEAMGNAPKWAREALEAIVQAAAPAASVLSWLDVGSHQDARCLQTMQARGYTHVLAVGAELPCLFPQAMDYLYVHALDVATYPLIDHFVDMVLFLRTVRASALKARSRSHTKPRARARVLVHCYAGMSRSVAAVAAFLIAEGYGVHQALQHIAARRIGASPNDGFLSQLHQWHAMMSSDNPPIPPGDGSLVLPLTLPSAREHCEIAQELHSDVLHTCLTSPVTPPAPGRTQESGCKSWTKQRLACNTIAPHNWVHPDDVQHHR